jgi:nucleoside-diphosphate-sugar epimerase
MTTASLSAHRPATTSRGGGPTDPSHDEELRRGIIHTAVSRPVAAALVVSFATLIAAVPVAQALLEKVKGDDSVLPDLFKRAPTRANLKQFEDDVEKSSYLKDAVQPRVQLLLTSRGHAGNKRAVIGRQPGWLFYVPGVLALAGPGFLDGDWQRARQKAALDDGDEPLFPDPRPAVLALHRALAARGIRLVLFPVPDKAALAPRELHGRPQTAVATNRDYPRFVAEMRAAGVLVFDPAPEALHEGEPPRFMAQDTHWTPAWMEVVAARLAAFVRENVALPPVTAPSLKTALTPVERVGDLVDMLKLPEGQQLYQPQKLVVRQVQDPAGPWAPKESADVLLHERVLVVGDGRGRVGRHRAAPGDRARSRPRRHRAERLGRVRHAQAAERGAGGGRGSPRGQEGGDLGVRLARARGGQLEALRVREEEVRVLVTGAAGVMGSRLVRALERRGHSVRGLVMPGDPLRRRLEGTACEVVEGDLGDRASLERACAGIELCYHLAAVILSPDLTVFDRVNRDGTAHMVAAATGVEHFIYVSSASVVYPRRTPYAESKLAAEEIVKAGAFAYTIVRPTLVYDEQGGEEFRRFLAYLQRFPVVPFVGRGTALKRPVYSEDVVEGLALIAGNERAHGRTYNFSGGEAISIEELARLMLAHHGQRKRFVHLPVPLCRALAAALRAVSADPPLNEYTIAGMINDADLDPAEAVRDLGYRPLGVRDGFARCFPAAVS